MSEPLATYLADHLAGAAHAIEICRAIREKYNDDLGELAGVLLKEISADREVLQRIANRAGSGSSELKEIGAWFAEKMTRFKLRHEGKDSLGTFEALEFLCLGIQGKHALWTALKSISAEDPGLAGIDYDQLLQRAADQHSRADAKRLELASLALVNRRRAAAI